MPRRLITADTGSIPCIASRIGRGSRSLLGCGEVTQRLIRFLIWLRCWTRLLGRFPSGCGWGIRRVTTPQRWPIGLGSGPTPLRDPRSLPNAGNAGIGFSFVAQRSDGIAEALSHIPVDDPRWKPALPQPRPAPHNNPNSPEADKEPDNPEEGPDNPEEEPDGVRSDKTEDGKPKPVRAHVIELTNHVKAYNWPDDGLRLVVRREPLHPGAQRSLFDSERYRYWGHWTNQPQPGPESDRDMRAHARVETHISRVKDQGGNRFPFTKYAPNRLWLHIVALTDTLIRWFQKLSLPKHHPLTRAKPKTLRPNLWHIPATISRHSRRTTLRIPTTWPTATLIATTHQQ